MLFGFIASAIAGFMLTAVPSWTGQKGFAGIPLIALALVWIAARVLIMTSASWPLMLPTIVDLAFLPLLAVLVMIPLIRSRNRNTPLLGSSGRPLTVNPLITLAYGLLTTAAVMRVFGLSLFGMSYPTVIAVAAIFWTTSLILFVGVYSPILWRPRADGKPG